MLINEEETIIFLAYSMIFTAFGVLFISLKGWKAPYGRYNDESPILKEVLFDDYFV